MKYSEYLTGLGTPEPGSLTDYLQSYLSGSDQVIAIIRELCRQLVELTDEREVQGSLASMLIKTENLSSFSTISREDPSLMRGSKNYSVYTQLPGRVLWSALSIDSKYITRVLWCGTRLNTWQDANSGLFTVGQWMSRAVPLPSGKSTDDTTPKRLRSFMRTLVGDIYWGATGPNRLSPADYESLAQWFQLSLLPRLIDVCAFDRHIELAIGKILAYGSVSSEKSFDREMRLVTEGRVLFFTDDGLMGLGPGSMVPKDEIHVLPGGHTHFVLRPRPKSIDIPFHTEFELIGDCFLGSHPDLSERSGEEEEPLQGSLPYEIIRNMGLPQWSNHRILLM